MHELFEALFGTCPHGLPGYHWLIDAWYVFMGLPLVIGFRLYIILGWHKVKGWVCGFTNT